MAPSAANRWLVPLMLLLAVVAGGICFLTYSLNWLQQRHQLRDTGAVVLYPGGKCPGLLWLFGEPGYDIVSYREEGSDPDGEIAAYVRQGASPPQKPGRALSEQEIKHLRAVFPEARLYSFGRSMKAAKSTMP